MALNPKPGYKLGTFSTGGCKPFPAIVLDDKDVVALRALGDQANITGTDDMVDFLRGWPTNREALGQAVAAIRSGDFTPPMASLENLQVHAPLVPGNLICAAANYYNHVLEFFPDPIERAGWAERVRARAASDISFLFGKSTSAVTDPYADIELPFDCGMVDWEVELVAVIGRRARRVSRESALDYVAGYTVGNDFSARDFMSRDDIQPGVFDFFGSKSNPGFSPIGPFIVPAEFVPDPQALHLRLKLNGDVMQDEGTDDMVDGVAKLIAFASSRMTLNPGDMIMTGSPSGNGKKHNRYLQAGDVVEAEIDGIGKQIVRFVAEPRP